MHIDWSVCSSDMSTILTCLCHFWTEGPTHNNGIKKPPASLCSIAGDIDPDPLAPNHKNYSEYAKPVLVLICWGHTRLLILILEMWCLRLSSYFHVNSKELHFKFWKHTCFSCVYEGILCSRFCEKWLWPLGYLTLCHNKGIGASKLK